MNTTTSGGGKVELHPLSQADAAFDKLRHDEMIGSAVIVPDPY